MANPWWSFYGKDYASKTGHLTMVQHGAYLILLNTYYTRGEPLPVNSEDLVRICRAHSAEEIEAISFILSNFFSLKSDGWHNKRADIELRKAKQYSKLQSKRAHMRWHSRGIANAHPETMLTQSHTHIHKTNTNPRAASAFELPDWISKESWTNYEQMRDKIRKSMTNPARKFAVRTLEKLRNEGNDPAAVLDQSTFNSWQGLFPLRSELNGPNKRNQSVPMAAARHFSNDAMFESELGVASEVKANGRRHEAVNSPRTINALGAGAK